MNRLHVIGLLALSFATVDAVSFAQGSCLHRNGQFAWNCAGPVSGMNCTHIIEVADPHSWNDNYFCAQNNIGMRWSSSSPVPGMNCTQIIESADTHTWNDNYLCVPANSPIHFQWSSRGRVSGQQCVQWEEPSDPDTWNDNFLCWTQPAPPPAEPASTERPDHRCGPEFDGAHCAPNRCCSVHGWCGSQHETHCSTEHGFSGQFDGH